MTRQEIASSLGTAGELVRQGRLREAESLCQAVIHQHPLNAETLHLLGRIAFRSGDVPRALGFLERAIGLSPNVAEFHNTLGTVLGSIGKPDDAAKAFSQAIALKSNYAEAQVNLGAALIEQRKFAEAEATLRNAVRLWPDYAEAHGNLALLLRNQGRLAEALEEFDSATRVNPKFRDGYAGRAAILRSFGDADGAADSFRHSLTATPNDSATHGDLIYAMRYQLDVSAEDLFKEHLIWGEHYALPFYGHIKPFANDSDANRRLRIGYTSADFCENPRARFIEPLLAQHDRRQFRVHCYSDVTHPDDLTGRFRQMADVWRETAGMSDETLAELIHRDGIDLLVDCTGHMGRNRMLMLARKAAPIQVLYPGYPNTSGLKTVDYWITDAYQDPPGLTQRFHTEQIVRLNPFARCYTPSENSPIPGPLPAKSNGFITFGALNNAVKNNSGVLVAWSRILSSLPSARMLVLVEVGAEKAIATAFARQGIPSDRLDIVTRVKREKYLELYQRTDILLDTFPYNGYTTTLDSLWMGVPVLTVAGDTNVSRSGVSILTNVGLPDWVAESCEDYVKRAVRFASDVSALSELRSRLRQQMQASPLMDAAGFIREIEAAYRMMWKTWCEGK